MQETQVQIGACELKNKVRVALFASVTLLAATGIVRAQEPSHPPAAQPAAEAHGDQHATDAHAAEEHHSSLAGLLWPTANFLILAGGLWWFLKDPLAGYLKDRHAGIRKELAEAAAVKDVASSQLAEIDRKLKALPGEIAQLRQRGAEEIAAEEQRISAQAAAERERLLEQTRREIDVQLRLAKRELVEHAADLAVQLAGERLQQQMTPDDQQRLVDRYLGQVAAPKA